MNHEYKYNKYKSKYLKLKSLVGDINIPLDKKYSLKGGAKKDTHKKNNDNDKENNNILKVNCIEVVQEDENESFKGSMCKTPSIKIRFHSSDVSLAFIVKSMLRLINKSLRIKNVKSVEIKHGDKKDSYKGDNLSKMIDLKKINSFDSVIIKL